MEGEVKIQLQKNCKRTKKKGKSEQISDEHQQKKQILNGDASPQPSDASEDGSAWSSEVIQPAIKTMSFRPKRGTRMKDLMRGKQKKDLFWDKYQNYFGGDLNQPDDSDDQEDYQASSSGRDQFDSDFDLTDSYVGKRGRKKGTKVKRRKKPISKVEADKPETARPPKGRPPKKKKVPQGAEYQQQQKMGQQLKMEPAQQSHKQPSVDNIMPVEQVNPSKAQIVENESEHQACRQGKSSSKKKSKNGSQGKICTPKHEPNVLEVQERLFLQ